MPLKILLTTILFINLIGCTTLDLEIEVPDCIESKIIDIKNKPVFNPPAEVWQWKINDQTYYYFTSDCCDQYNYLYNEACEVVCAPDGGMTGQGDGNCPEYNDEDIIKTLVWKDDR